MFTNNTTLYYKIFYKQLSYHDYKKNPFSSETLIKLPLSDSVQSHDLNKMQHDTSDILFSAFKNTFVMKGFIVLLTSLSINNSVVMNS